MLWFLLTVLPVVSCTRVVSNGRTASSVERHYEEQVAVTTGPRIHKCRSPNMEEFSCWWHPLDNSSHGDDNITYVLTYTRDKGPKYECPNYVTSGPHSCYFDKSHTSVWMVYCLNVTAITAHRNYTSQEHCLDVAEIVQTDAPVNLTYSLTDAGEDETGYLALVSWTYPDPAHIQFGWITLVFELHYRRLTEPDNWKLKQDLREPHVELLGLPVGEYVIRVRCRSRNSRLWSEWSPSILMAIPARPAPGKLVALILATGVGVVALLVIGFGIIPQSKRIKTFLLPPIPRPRIIGIDPLLLKKGQIEEINRHLTSFHGYTPPRYSEEVWDQVSMDSCPALQEPLGVPVKDQDNPAPVAHPPARSPAPYCLSPPAAFAPVSSVPVPDVPTQWAWPGIVALPGTDYSMMAAPASQTVPPPQDFYTCVHLMNDSGEVHLVPCLAPTADGPAPRGEEGTNGVGGAGEKKQQLMDYVNRKAELAPAGRRWPLDGGADEQNEGAGPPLVALNNRV